MARNNHFEYSGEYSGDTYPTYRAMLAGIMQTASETNFIPLWVTFTKIDEEPT